MDDPPPIPPKLYPQLELEVLPEDLSVLHSLPSLYKKEERFSKKPSPAPRLSLSVPGKKKHLVPPPVPKPRILAKHTKLIDNPLYFDVSIQALSPENNETDCSELDGNPFLISNSKTSPLPAEESNIHLDVLSQSPEEVVLEFDPYAPSKGFLNEDHLNLKLSNSVFGLDNIITSTDGETEEFETKESLISFVQEQLDNIISSVIHSSNENSCSSAQKNSDDSVPFLSDTLFCVKPVSENETNFASSSFDHTDHVNPDSIPLCLNEEAVETMCLQEAVTNENEETNTEDCQSLSSVDLDPPSFPPPPLPDGFSGSSLSLLETEGFFEAYECIAKHSERLPSSHSRSSSSSSILSDRPPLPPKSQFRSYSKKPVVVDDE